jgi:hypothetical protein
MTYKKKSNPINSKNKVKEEKKDENQMKHTFSTRVNFLELQAGMTPDSHFSGIGNGS